MEASRIPAPRAVRPRRERARKDWRDGRAWGVADEIAGMLGLVWRCLRIWARNPLGPAAGVMRESAGIIRTTAIPLALCASFFDFGALAVLTLGVLERLGADDRYGFVTAIGGIREFNGWFSGMCVAGIAGTAICADLGSRRVREELDAMRTLAIDPEEVLVLPRMIAITFMTPVLFLFGSIVSIASGAIAGQILVGYPMTVFIHSFATYPVVDLLAALAKMTVIGFAIAVVCCFKGMNASGGPAGVGKAVNQAVVLAFTATWVLDLLVNTFFLAAFPSAQAIR
ncbi:MAG: hypothetical protein JWM31_2723 [Solirubrobacterales bacterium]|nr:hypothetical protein [Solirubrobacterales bacterium]